MSYFRTAGLVLALAFLAPSSLAAQSSADPYRPHATWRTIDTERFTVHFPAEAEAWTHRLVGRMDAMGEAVTELIGHAPPRRVTVVVADPFNTSNGFAVSLLDWPHTVLWTTPPDPRSGIGEHREWGEMLFVHEYAHLAHLTFESRNPSLRFRQRVVPQRRGPVNRATPRWIREGYATFVEGQITGHGRPHGTHRPAFLRLRALEGRLPTYAGLNGGQGYQDMAAAYFTGSAYLEWLEERSGPGSLRDVWRRLSAHQQRSFPAAFAGVLGGNPDELYGLFTVDLTAKALAVRDSLAAVGGLVEGALVQARRWHTGDPALSPDGEWLAVELHERNAPSRLVVWQTTPDPPDSAREAQAIERLLARDSLDVPGVRWQPRAHRAAATLRAVGGRGHRNPRFLPDGKQILVVRTEPLGDGTLRPDLFIWNHETGALRRVTRGAGIRDADPSPDGQRAASVRCSWGICDIVEVDLATGSVATLAAGSPDVVYYRPRYSPDGSTIVASVQERGRWQLVALPAAGGVPRPLGPDDGASRYDAAFLDAAALVAVSTRGGIANLEHIDLATGEARSLTRTLGAVAAPAPNLADGSVFFLKLHSRGWDVHRLHPDSVEVSGAATLAEPLWPIAAYAPSVEPDTFLAGDVPQSRAYGLGPRRTRLLPAGYYGEDGGAVHVALATTDPLGRLTGNVQGAFGDAEAWRGGSASLVLRRFPVHIGAAGFAARQQPRGVADATEYYGGLLALSLIRDRTPARLNARVAVSAAGLRGTGLPTDRNLAFAELTAETVRIDGRTRTPFRFEAHAAAGQTSDETWTRADVSAGTALRFANQTFEMSAAYGRLSADAPMFERFQIGGSAPVLFDRALLRQRIAMPALPAGLVTGESVLSGRVSLGRPGFRPFLWAASVDDFERDWLRVIGIESAITMNPSHLAAFPGADIVFGVAQSLDEPFRRKTRAYFSVGLRP